MQCIVCSKNLEKKYFVWEKLGMKIYFCNKHKMLCDNECTNYECVESFCKPIH